MSQLNTPNHPVELVPHTFVITKPHADVGAIIRQMLTGQLDPSKPLNLGQFNGHGAMIESLFEGYRQDGAPKVIEMLAPLARAEPELGQLIFGQADQPVLPPSERKFYSAAEYIERPPVKYLDEERTIQEGGITTIFGSPASGKSLIHLRKGLQIAERLPVLLVLSEGQHGMADRLRAEQILRNAPLSRHFYITDAYVDLSSETAVRQFIGEILSSDINPRLIVLDTLSGCMPNADENDGTQMKKVIYHCKLIIQALGCSILLVHHTIKAGKQYRGHSILHSDSDIMFLIEEAKGVVKMKAYKSKDGPLAETKSYRIKSVVTRQDPDTGKDVMGAALVPEQAPQVAVVEKKPTLPPQQRKVLEALQTAGTEGMGYNALMNATEISRSSLSKVLDLLIEAGYVYQEFARQPYTITEAGEEQLTEQAE